MKTELEIYQEKLQQKTEELEEFIYIVSHDVKAPLRAITNLTAWIADDLEEIQNDEIKENIKLLKSRVSRMERMLSALTDISRIGRMELEVMPVDVKKLCEEIIELNQFDKAVKVEFGEMPKFNTYRFKLKRVLTELLKNALASMNSQKNTIHIETREKDDYFQFTIRDNGCGMPEEALEKVKKIFYTVHIKDDIDTTGAGLTIADKIVDFVGGSMEIQSKIEQGTTISFSWPKLINVQPN